MRKFFFVFLLLFTMLGFAQTKITWETLRDVQFTDKYSQDLDAYYYYPHFGVSVKALEGKELIIDGFMLVISRKNEAFVLSKNPYAQCFFCGNGGPESIIELDMKPGYPYFKMDQRVTIKGRLKLNQDNFYRCNYILEEAEVIQ